MTSHHGWAQTREANTVVIVNGCSWQANQASTVSHNTSKASLCFLSADIFTSLWYLFHHCTRSVCTMDHVQTNALVWNSFYSNRDFKVKGELLYVCFNLRPFFPVYVYVCMCVCGGDSYFGSWSSIEGGWCSRQPRKELAWDFCGKMGTGRNPLTKSACFRHWPA